MNRLVQWLARRRLTPAAAQIEFFSRRVTALEAMVCQQHSLIEGQNQAVKTLKAALIRAQFDAEGWRQVAHEQARQIQHRPAAAKEAP
jgi:hypothetical protein